jgi:hypothetical protein
MDTFKEKQKLDNMYANGEAPWQVWNPTGEHGVKRGKRVKH